MNFRDLFFPSNTRTDADAAAPSGKGLRRQAALTLKAEMEAANFGHYMMLADTTLNLVSIFDDLKYDRADADILSPAMRRHALEKLKRLGFRQTSGTVLEHPGSGTRCHMPKFHALGASPFDITRYTPKGPRDYYLLTPTQTACQYIDNYDHGDAVARVKELVQKQPINLYRLMDYLERKPAHESFHDAIGHLRLVQREAVESEPLQRRRALG